MLINEMTSFILKLCRVAQPDTMRPLVTRLRPSLTRVAIRRYAVQAPGAPTLQVFDRRHKWMQKERAASNVEESRKVDYLKNEVANRLCERLLVRVKSL